MPRFIVVILMLALTSNVCLGSEGDAQANSFANIYALLCMKNLLNLEALREQLKPMPQFPPEKAAPFLGGRPGDAWPVPDKHGKFVLTIHSSKNFCAVHAHRASTETAIKRFTSLVADAPYPLIATQVKNEQTQDVVNGPVQTVSYEWSTPGAPLKLLFTLSTAPSDSAELQVLGSAAVIRQ